MKIFLSWSGRYTNTVASHISEWLPFIFADVQTFYSPEIEKGTNGIQTISNALLETSIGIICLDITNVPSPWINFEAGALSKLENSRVYTLLMGINPSNIPANSPLTHFQHTKFEKEDFFKIIKSINQNTDAPRDEARLRGIFDKFWPDLVSNIEGIEEYPETGEIPELSKEREILEELLTTVRSIDVSSISSATSQDWQNNMTMKYDLEKLRSLENVVVNYLFSVLKPASKPEIEAWLAGSDVVDQSQRFPHRNTLFASEDFVMPPLYGAQAVTILVKEGVRVYRARDIGHSTLLFMDGFRAEGL